MQVHDSEVPVLERKLIKSNVNIHLFSLFFFKDVFPYCVDLEINSIIHVAVFYSFIFGPWYL